MCPSFPPCRFRFCPRRILAGQRQPPPPDERQRDDAARRSVGHLWPVLVGGIRQFPGRQRERRLRGTIPWLHGQRVGCHGVVPPVDEVQHPRQRPGSEQHKLR